MKVRLFDRFRFQRTQSGKAAQGRAFDSMLAVSLDGDDYHPRYGCSAYEVTADRVVSVWSPFPNVTVRTEVIPLPENWHVRIHRLTCGTDVYAAEGGFAIARDGNGEAAQTVGEKAAVVRAPWGTSAIYALSGYEQASVVTPEPNTNLMSPRTLLPTLTVRLAAGEHTLVCAVYGSPDGAAAPFYRRRFSAMQTWAEAAFFQMADKYRKYLPLAAEANMIPYMGGKGRWLPAPIRQQLVDGRLLAGADVAVLRATGDKAFLAEARRVEALLVNELMTFEKLNHDVGFMYFSPAARTTS
jgi:hypothetical protein